MVSTAISIQCKLMHSIEVATEMRLWCTPKYAVSDDKKYIFGPSYNYSTENKQKITNWYHFKFGTYLLYPQKEPEK